jgi:hypothetical protein
MDIWSLKKSSVTNGLATYDADRIGVANSHALVT